MAGNATISNHANNPERSVHIFRPLKVMGRTVDIECDLLVINPSAETSSIAKAALVPGHNAIATAMAAAIGKERGAGTELCVYVIAVGDGSASKIGVSNNPAKRLKELQLANAKPLSVHALFWVYGPAFVLEKRALDLAVGHRACGEWVSLTPERTAEIVIEAVKSGSIPVATSAMWLKNRRTESVARIEFRTARDRPDHFLGFAQQFF